MQSKDLLINFRKQKYYNIEQTKFDIFTIREQLFKTLTPSQKQLYKKFEKLNKKLQAQTLTNFANYICQSQKTF